MGFMPVVRRPRGATNRVVTDVPNGSRHGVVGWERWQQPAHVGVGLLGIEERDLLPRSDEHLKTHTRICVVTIAERWLGSKPISVLSGNRPEPMLAM